MSSLVSYFLRRDLESCCPHINLLVHVNAGDDKEDPRAPRSSRHKSAQSEDDGSLVLLDHLHDEEEREWHGGDDEQHREHRQKMSEHTWTLLADWKPS